MLESGLFSAHTARTAGQPLLLLLAVDADRPAAGPWSRLDVHGTEHRRVEGASSARTSVTETMRRRRLPRPRDGADRCVDRGEGAGARAVGREAPGAHHPR